MSKLNKFLGKPKEFEIEGEKMKIFPLEVKDMGILQKLTSKDSIEREKAIFDLMKVSMKEEEGITEDEVNNMILGVKNKIMDAILEVNGLDENIKNAKKGIITQS